MKLKFTVAAFLLAGFAAWGQTAEPISELTYKEAVKIALSKNVNLNQQKNLLEYRQVAKTAAIANLGPNLFIQGGGSRNIGQQQNPENGNLENLTVDNFGASIGSQITVFNGFARVNQLQSSINQFKAQAAFVSRSEQDVIYNVTIQFLQVLLDQELLKIANENFNSQNTLLDQIRESVKLGARPEADLYNQDAQTKNMQLIALRAQVTLENDKATLAQTLQLDPSIPVQVAVPDPSTANNVSLNLSLDSLFAIAMESRPDLKQLNYQATANKHLVKSATAGYYPNVTFGASYGSGYYSSLSGNPVYGGFSNQFVNVLPNTNYQFNFNIPLFSRFANRSQRMLSKVTYDNSVLQRDNLEKTIKIDVQRAYNNYKAAIQSYEASIAQAESGELALKTQQESYLLGVANQVTLAQANQTFVQAAASKAQAAVTLLFQSILLDYALGTLKFDNIPE
jgi:outer membrane protein